MVEGIGMKQVRLVQEEDGVQALLAELLDVRADRVEDRRRGGRGAEPQGEAELTVEVALTERRVVTVGKTELGWRETVAHGAQDARLAEPGVAEQERALSLGGGLTQTVDHILFGGRKPEVAVLDLLDEGCQGEAEEGDIGGSAHCVWSFLVLAPLAIVAAGLKVTRGRAAFCGSGARNTGRFRLALWTGSTGWRGKSLPSS